MLAPTKLAAGLAPDDPRHGKPSSYTNWGCRCDECRAAWAAYKRATRKPAA